MKSASPVVSASKVTNSMYLVNTSVMQRTIFFPWPEVLRGPNKSMFTLWFGAVHCGKGESRVGWGLSSFLFWHLWHSLMCPVILGSIFGKKYDSLCFTFVFEIISCPVKSCPCASLNNASLKTCGTHKTVLGVSPPCCVKLKHSLAYFMRFAFACLDLNSCSFASGLSKLWMKSQIFLRGGSSSLNCGNLESNT